MSETPRSSRPYCFAIPALMDGAISIAQTATPLVAVRMAASPWFLGMLGWVAQTARLPFCFTAGRLSERIGRIPLIVTAALLFIAATLGLSFAGGLKALLGFQVLMLVSIGIFYPPLQALIADRSPKGQLARNLSAFNLGWCLGGSVSALSAGYLLQAYVRLPFWVSAMMVVVVVGVLFSWKDRQSHTSGGTTPVVFGRADPNLLLAARMAHFLSFFAVGMCRSMFPQLGRLQYSEGIVGVLIAMHLVGQTAGILLANSGPWWRGKLWPILASQGLVCAGGLLLAVGHSAPAYGIALFVIGVGLGVPYTGALYYGLQARERSGHNAGIHESLVAGGAIAGALLGGATAQWIGLRAPYVVIAITAAALLLGSGAVGLLKPIRTEPED